MDFKDFAKFHKICWCSFVTRHNLAFFASRIKALLLRWQNDYFGDAFGHASAALQQAAAAAAKDGRKRKRRNKKIFFTFFIADFFYCGDRLKPFYCGALSSTAVRRNREAAIETATGALLRRSSIATPRNRKRSAKIRALLYGPENIEALKES